MSNSSLLLHTVSSPVFWWIAHSFVCRTFLSLTSPISSSDSHEMSGLRPAQGHLKVVWFLCGESLTTAKATFTSSRMSREESTFCPLSWFLGSTLHHAASIRGTKRGSCDSTAWRAWHPEGLAPGRWRSQLAFRGHPVCNRLCQGCEFGLGRILPAADLWEEVCTCSGVKGL